MRKGKIHALLLFCLLLTVSGCSRPGLLDRQTSGAYVRGTPEEGEAMLSRRINKAMPNGTYRKCKDAAWLLLDRGFLELSHGATKEAIADFNLALEAIDYYNQKPFGETLGQLLLEDSVAAYPIADFERLLTHVYFALTLYHEGDQENAAAVLRGAEHLQQKLNEQHRGHKLTKELEVANNSAAKYLLALLSERTDRSNAEILYKQAGFELPQTGEATLLVIGHGGLAPQKVSMPIPDGLVSMVALEALLKTKGAKPAHSTFIDIKVPLLIERIPSPPLSLAIDGYSSSLQPLFSVSNAAFDEESQKLPLLTARAIARRAARRAIVTAAEKKNESLASFVDLVMFVANHTTEADIRQWGLLPDSITFSRHELSAGTHTVTLPNGEHELDLAPGDICIIQLFYPSEQQVSSIIPTRYLATQGEQL